MRWILIVCIVLVVLVFGLAAAVFLSMGEKKREWRDR